MVQRIGFFGVKNFKAGDVVRLRVMGKQCKNRPLLTTELYKIVNTHKHKIFVQREDGSGKVLERDESDVEFAILEDKPQIDSDCEIIDEINDDPSKRLQIRNGAAIRMYRGGLHTRKGVGRGERIKH